VPPQDGVGSHDREGLSPPGPDPGQPDPEKTIRRAKPGPGRRPLVHGELLTQGEVLDRKLAVAAAEEREQAKQVGQESDHRAGLCQDQIRQINDLTAGRGFGEGQRCDRCGGSPDGHRGDGRWGVQTKPLNLNGATQRAT